MNRANQKHPERDDKLVVNDPEHMRQVPKKRMLIPGRMHNQNGAPAAETGPEASYYTTEPCKCGAHS